MKTQTLPIIGNSTLVTIAGIPNIPAKIDTGAEFSSIWASDIRVTEDGQLEFCFFAPESPFYTGEKITCRDFWARPVRNSTGDETIRYRVQLQVELRGRRITTDFTLGERSRNNFSILIGRQTLAGKFLVDVSLPEVNLPSEVNLSSEGATLAEANAQSDDVLSKTGDSAKPLSTIGSTALVTIAGIPNIPAKIDTGARTSAIWASNIRVTKDNQLEFCLFAPESPFYTGKKLYATEFKVRRIRNSTGDEEDRYRVHLPIIMGDRSIRAKFTLSDRSRSTFPVLIGRRALFGKFMVDVSDLQVNYPLEKPGETELNAELRANPLKFHQKYMLHAKKAS